jgi:hypothetical protein
MLSPMVDYRPAPYLISDCCKIFHPGHDLRNLLLTVMADE